MTVCHGCGKTIEGEPSCELYSTPCDWRAAYHARCAGAAALRTLEVAERASNREACQVDRALALAALEAFIAVKKAACVEET